MAYCVWYDSDMSKTTETTRKPRDLYRKIHRVADFHSDDFAKQVKEAECKGSLNFSEAEWEWFGNLSPAALRAGMKKAAQT